MGARRNQIDMAESLSSPFFGDDFDTALFARYALVTDFFVFAAMAFVVLAWTKDLLAE